MADVVSEVSDGAVATAEGCGLPPSSATEAADNEDMTANEGVDEVSIHKILEGMTSEFNRSVSPTKHVESDDEIAVVTENTTILPLSPSMLIEEVSIEEQKRDKNGEDTAVKAEETAVQAIPEENHKGEDDGSIGQQETLKKDNGIPRIVLTFRTIDENTDHGKKTKISSCSSNLTLVPDDLANCDRISGVSVKIENSDDNSDNVEEPSAEEVKVERSVKKPESKDVTENMVKDTEEEFNNTQVSVEEKAETTRNNSESNPESNVETELAEGTEQKETAAPVTRKRRTGRPRLRALRFPFVSPLFMFARVYRVFNVTVSTIFFTSYNDQTGGNSRCN